MLTQDTQQFLQDPNFLSISLPASYGGWRKSEEGQIVSNWPKEWNINWAFPPISGQTSAYQRESNSDYPLSLYISHTECWHNNTTINKQGWPTLPCRGVSATVPGRRPSWPAAVQKSRSRARESCQSRRTGDTSGAGESELVKNSPVSTDTRRHAGTPGRYILLENAEEENSFVWTKWKKLRATLIPLNIII